MTTDVDTVLDVIARLSLEDQEMVDEIMHHRIIDCKREEIRTEYRAALEERMQGQTKSGSVDQLFGSL